MNMGSPAGSGQAGTPDRMTDRWRDRPEPGPDDAQLYWHVLMRDQPQARALAAVARRRLAGCGAGLHFTPEPWLHLSVLRLGLARELAQPALEAMVDQARSRLAALPSAQVTLGRVLYHPEAVALRADPADGLAAVTEAGRDRAGRAGDSARHGGLQHAGSAGRAGRGRARPRAAPVPGHDRVGLPGGPARRGAGLGVAGNGRRRAGQRARLTSSAQ
jgi:hypothetical protein